MGPRKKMIKNIVKNFDFKKVNDVMEYLNWTWVGKPNSPTIENLKKSAKERLKCAYNLAKEEMQPDVTYFSSSGGLKASALCNEVGNVVYLNLEFVLTEWEETIE